MRTRKWTKDGQDHYTTEIVAEEMQMLDAPERESLTDDAREWVRDLDDAEAEAIDARIA